ncbi:Quinolinate phosphoribosyl transferase [Protomyces lactucae-debilis]|uniref:Nicotinate phosphoribosyltransferase n=1 Tax=Protomyces lactucae-debilis TaxID=2754530 RepID=A0A1Y2FUX0_PROLT|nr:Quinolinate phosphoribosyl transferase [Protomyces lactucae-debilis]ORY87792.1 Quinolinate phosphoribosyl transferase [Protomyces lactucae-debilis]
MAQMNPEGVASLLDTDFYKITMQAAIFHHYPDVEVSYKFFNRSPEMKLNAPAFSWLETQVARLGDLSIADDEIAYLRSHCAYLPDKYLEFLRQFRLRPQEQVHLCIDQDGQLQISIEGLWKETILYEIPLLSLVSEAYFKFVDTDWTYDGQVEKASAKGKALLEAGCLFSEFGTRRRRDYKTQDLVLQGLLAAAQGKSEDVLGQLVGTSNIHFAARYNLKAIGTVAHEWFMGTAAISGDYLHANRLALLKWREVYGDELGIALTDTFSTDAFLRDFEKDLATSFAGVRQDSGSPEDFAKRIVEHYKKLDIDPAGKAIVFSDSLNVKRCIGLQDVCKGLGIPCSFGIGTFLTNDYVTQSKGTKSPAMNIVIKLNSAAGKPAVKISDDVHKHTGDPAIVAQVNRLLGHEAG